MLKIVAAGVTALFVAASPTAYAEDQSPPTEHPNASDWSALTDARINLVKAALQLTPDQERYWPPIENAIRARAMNQQGRITRAMERIEKVRERGLMETLRTRDPVTFLHRRADSLKERAADLNKLADAWEPLYQTLQPEQRQRLAFLTVFVLRRMRNVVEQRRMEMEDDEE
jgi:hypothetical protein